VSAGYSVSLQCTPCAEPFTAMIRSILASNDDRDLSHVSLRPGGNQPDGCSDRVILLFSIRIGKRNRH